MTEMAWTCSFTGETFHRRCLPVNFAKFFRTAIEHSRTAASKAVVRMCSVKKVLLKFSGLHACNLIKKRLQHRCFSVNFAKFLRTPVFVEHLRWLLLLLLDKNTYYVINILYLESICYIRRIFVGIVYSYQLSAFTLLQHSGDR